MKGLVLIGEGHGEVSALPILVRKLLKERAEPSLYVDDEVIRCSASQIIKWDKDRKQPDYIEWIKRVKLAARRRNMSGVLAVFDADAKYFPPGSKIPFCAATIARQMAAAAEEAGAGKIFSLATVFACTEYETWLVAGAESLKGRRFPDGRPALVAEARIPTDCSEAPGKAWIEKYVPYYRPARDQGPLTEVLDIQIVRGKKLRSFQRLEHAVDLLLDAAAKERPIVTPAR